MVAIRPSSSVALAGFAFFLALAAPGTLAAKTITIDGDPGDWTGTPPSSVHDVSISDDEWIYKGEAGDQRNDPPDPGVRPNYDITEVRLTSDATNLYILVRMADITVTDEVSVSFGIDNDQSAGDANGLVFLGDESGVTFAQGAEAHPEYVVHVHNATTGITTAEFFHDAGSGFWYSNPADSDTYISTVNDVVEIRISLAALELTTSSTFGFGLVTFDNGSTADPSIVGFNNDTDTTVDYPGNDALDGIGGTPGVSQNAYDRVFPPIPPGTDPGPYTRAGLLPVSLPVVASIDLWMVLGAE